MLKSPLQRDSTFLILHRCFGVGLQLLLTLFLTRRVDLQTFSNWSFIQSLVLIFSLLDFPLVSALQNAFVKYQCENKETSSKILYFTFFQITLGSFGILCMIALGIALYFPLDSEYFWLVPVLFFLSLKTLFQFSRAGMFAYHEIFSYILADMIGLLFAACFVVSAALLQCTPSWLLGGYSAIFSLSSIYSSTLFSRRRNWNWIWIPYAQMQCFLSQLLKPITLLFFQNIAGILLFSADVTLIYYLCDSIEVSRFYLYQRVFNGVLLITLPITTVAWVRFADDYERGKFQEMTETLLSICKLSLGVIFVIGGGIWFFHNEILLLLSGHPWGNSHYAIAFYLNIFLVTFQSIFSTALNAIGIHKVQLKTYLLLLGIKIAIIAWLVKEIGPLSILWITNGMLLPMIGVNLWIFFHTLRGKRLLHTP